MELRQDGIRLSISYPLSPLRNWQVAVRHLSYSCLRFFGVSIMSGLVHETFSLAPFHEILSSKERGYFGDACTDGP